MLAKQRRDQILAELQRLGSVRVSDLAASFEVSDMTIRRDLDALRDDGLAEKVHGGAIHPGRTAEEPGFEKKRLLERNHKKSIAREALKFVDEGSSIALSAGTTTWYLAQLLSNVARLTVLTNSTNVATELQRTATADTHIILTGGDFRTPSDALVGPFADATIRSLYVDVLFLGVHGLDLESGLTTPNPAEVETNRTMIARARKVVVIADHSKWRTVGLCTIAPLDVIDVLITDDELDAESLAVLENHVGEVVVASWSNIEAAARAG